MRCPYCKNEHPDDSQFCPVTGKAISFPIAPKIAETYVICKNCKARLTAEARFCPVCGVATAVTAAKWNYIKLAGIGAIIIGVVVLAIISSKTGWSQYSPPINNPTITIHPTITPIPSVLALSPTVVQNSSQDWIVFERWIWCPEDKTWGCKVELWLIRSDGSDLHKLTQDYYDVGPSWSPNGQHIAFSRHGYGIEGIFFVDLEDTNPHRISSNLRAYYPQWITNNQLIFAMPRGPEQEFTQSWRLYTASLESDNELLFDVGLSGVFSPKLSSDRQYLAFHAGDGNVYISAIDGSDVRRLESPQGAVKGYPIAWYPDDSQLVVAAEGNCLKVNLDNSKIKPLLGISECNISWSPDRNLATYQFNNAIWIMDINGQNKRLLITPNDESHYRDPVWSP